MSKNLYFIGNNLATIIGAYESAKSGKSVTIFTDGNTLGGYFAGINLKGHDFDFGMFLFEQFRENTRIEKRSTINSWLDNGLEISDWLNNEVSLKRAKTPETYILGEKYPDYIMTNRLDAYLSQKVKAPESLSIDNPYHAFHKENGSEYDEISYYEASRYNHGEELHFLYIEPFIKKIIGHSSDKFLARYHRFSWAPLYYPNTIREVLLNKKITLEEYPFWTTENGFIGDLVRNITNKIKKMDNVNIVNYRLNNLEIGKNKLIINDSEYKLNSKVVLGLSMDKVHELLNTQKSLKGIGIDFSIAFTLVHRNSIKDIIGCVFIVDDVFGSYRITDQDAIAGLDPEWHRVVIEANSKILQEKYPDISSEDAIIKDIKSYFKITGDDHINILKILNIKNGLYLPTKEFVKEKKLYSNLILDLSEHNVILTGDLLNYGTSSINNQIAQGLKLGVQL